MKIKENYITTLLIIIIFMMFILTGFIKQIDKETNKILLDNSEKINNITLMLEDENITEEIKKEEIKELTTEEVTTQEQIETLSDTIYNNLSSEDIYLIQRCVETETYQADIPSKVNVACVIFNRLKDGRFGSTISEIITTEQQFAYFREEISDETIIAVEEAWKCDSTNGALYFHSNLKTDTFCGAVYIFTDAVGHNFYK